ncbi:MAG: hypothetical protein ACRDTT_10510, partial [Pseudonocardiaceae bacterium]
ISRGFSTGGDSCGGCCDVALAPGTGDDDPPSAWTHPAANTAAATHTQASNVVRGINVAPQGPVPGRAGS